MEKNKKISMIIIGSAVFIILAFSFVFIQQSKPQKILNDYPNLGDSKKYCCVLPQGGYYWADDRSECATGSINEDGSYCNGGISDIKGNTVVCCLFTKTGKYYYTTEKGCELNGKQADVSNCKTTTSGGNTTTNNNGTTIGGGNTTTNNNGTKTTGTTGNNRGTTGAIGITGTTVKVEYCCITSQGSYGYVDSIDKCNGNIVTPSLCNKRGTGTIIGGNNNNNNNSGRNNSSSNKSTAVEKCYKSSNGEYLFGIYDTKDGYIYISDDKSSCNNIKFTRINNSNSTLTGGQISFIDLADSANNQTFDVGSVDISMLKPGFYTIKEIKAPQGYNVDNNQIDVVVNEDGTINVGGNAKYNVGNTNYTRNINLLFSGEVLPEACYKDTNGEYRWTNSPLSSETLISSIKTQDECKKKNDDNIGSLSKIIYIIFIIIILVAIFSIIRSMKKKED